MRVMEGAYRSHDLDHGIGYYHKLIDDSRPAPFRLTRPIPPAPPARPASEFFDFAAIARRWYEETTPEVAADFAERLGVSVMALHRLGAGRAAERKCWSFPMHDDKRQVIGIRLRSDRGDKFAVTGSHSGCFVASAISSKADGLLVVCEGPTDTAAALTLGYDAIGRPSATGGTEIVCEILTKMRKRDVVIVRDVDGPGVAGANSLADRLVPICRTVRIVSPAPAKDLREWLRQGGTRAQLQSRINNTVLRV